MSRAPVPEEWPGRLSGAPGAFARLAGEKGARFRQALRFHKWRGTTGCALRRPKLPVCLGSLAEPLPGSSRVECFGRPDGPLAVGLRSITRAPSSQHSSSIARPARRASTWRRSAPLLARAQREKLELQQREHLGELVTAAAVEERFDLMVDQHREGLFTLGADAVAAGAITPAQELALDELCRARLVAFAARGTRSG